jgi:hypothetical protein
MAHSTTAPADDFRSMLEARIESGDLEEFLSELDPWELEELREDEDYADLLLPKRPDKPSTDDDDSWLLEEEARRREEEGSHER